MIPRNLESHACERLVGLGRAEPAAQSDFEGQILPDGQLWFESVAVSEITEARVVAIAVCPDRAATPGDCPLLRLEESCEHTQKSRLAGSVRPRDMNAAARGDFDGDPADHFAIAAPDLELLRGKS